MSAVSENRRLPRKVRTLGSSGGIHSPPDLRVIAATKQCRSDALRCAAGVERAVQPPSAGQVTGATGAFPFSARWIGYKSTSPLRKGEIVEVSRMAKEEPCECDMLVQIKWQDRQL